MAAPDPVTDADGGYDTTNLALKQLKEFNDELNASKLGDMNVRARICKTKNLRKAIRINPSTGEVGNSDVVWGCDGTGKIAIKNCLVGSAFVRQRYR